ncbi:MAG: hypothetical protein EPO10_04035 [Reyranella sp.]|uniref:hypothetical protein n=1 Tax=Reyranella sp. TaxID=1929291 RepID=UPI001219DCB1|nr:hypothetical protein [Reyranella sp.]TBR30209.1 MAG: hypothetical protein EPO10_04035 [Reyranella sp.]
MALTTTTNKVIHAGNGSATVFPYGFPILSASHLSVIYTNAAGAETTLSPSEYSVTGIGARAGGSVTYTRSGSPIASGTKLTILRTVPYTQTTVLSNQGGYYPEVVEARLDLITMAMQQLAEIVGRYTVSSISDPATEQSNYALIQALQATVGGVDKLTSQGDLLTRDASAYKRLARGTTDQVLSVSGADLIWRTLAAYPVFSGLSRQTVAAGPVTTAGLPGFLPSTNAALSVTSTNVSSTYPLVATAAAGWSATTGGPVDVIGYSTANLSWTGLTASRAAATPNFLYVTIANGLMTPGSTLLAPVYQWGGTPAVTAGQFTFNIAEMRGYLGNGTTAPQVNLVMVGEAATDGTGVISTVAYAYNGKFASAFTATLPGAGAYTSANHNIGIKPRSAKLVIECISAEIGYSVGDQITEGHIAIYSTVFAPVPIVSTGKTVGFQTPASTSLILLSRTTGTPTQLTVANWKYSLVAERGW